MTKLHCEQNRTMISIHAKNMAETSLQFVFVDAPLLCIEKQENQTLQGKQNDTDDALLMLSFFHFQTKGELLKYEHGARK